SCRGKTWICHRFPESSCPGGLTPLRCPVRLRASRLFRSLVGGLALLDASVWCSGLSPPAAAMPARVAGSSRVFVRRWPVQLRFHLSFVGSTDSCRRNCELPACRFREFE